MANSKIVQCMAMLSACLLIGVAFSQDWLEGGYVRSNDRSALMDKGIAGMVRWLDAPVYSYPWYSSDVSFYKKAVPATAFSPYKEYYVTTGSSVPGMIVSNPIKFDISNDAPSRVYYGTGQGLSYTQYASIVPSRANDLWIKGAKNWTQHLICPVGATLQLVGNAPLGGSGVFYETVQNSSTGMRHQTCKFYSGYNTMSFFAGQIGRNMLYFVINNQPSNVIIVDVFAQDQTNTVNTIASTPSQLAGDTPVTIQSRAMRGYQVFLDESYIGTEGAGGDVLDGVFSFRVVGGQNHNIRVYDGQFNYPRSIYFSRGILKIINVEPGTTVYF